MLQLHNIRTNPENANGSLGCDYWEIAQLT